MLLCREYCVPEGLQHPRSWRQKKIMTSRNRKEIPFSDIAQGQRDDTKSLRGLLAMRDVLAIYSDKALTGHNKSSTGNPAAKSDRDWMAKVRGRGRTAVLVYAKNSGTYETAVAEEEKDNSREACSSLTHSADARVTKKKGYRVKSRRED